MRNSGWKAKAGLAALAIGTCLALSWVAEISTGTGYPRSSTLSSAPAGSKLLFEVLQRSGRFSSIERNYLPPEQFHPQGSTVLYLGLTAYGFGSTNDSILQRYEGMARDGNRVVLAIETGAYRIGPKWRQLSGSDVWERRFGTGAVWIVINANRLSNRQLATSESARALVPLLAADSHRIWFDEAHLGVIETGSIAGLMRRYRMQGLVAGCLLFTALLLWRNAARFPPASAGEKESETVVVGSDAQGMMTELLSRHIPPAQLIEACRAEWNRVEPRRHLHAGQWPDRDPVAAYREIAMELGVKRVRKS